MKVVCQNGELEIDAASLERLGVDWIQYISTPHTMDYMRGRIDQTSPKAAMLKPQPPMRPPAICLRPQLNTMTALRPAPPPKRHRTEEDQNVNRPQSSATKKLSDIDYHQQLLAFADQRWKAEDNTTKRQLARELVKQHKNVCVSSMAYSLR